MVAERRSLILDSCKIERDLDTSGGSKGYLETELEVLIDVSGCPSRAVSETDD